jgi:hypothetical protein
MRLPVAVLLVTLLCGHSVVVQGDVFPTRTVFPTYPRAGGAQEAAFDVLLDVASQGTVSKATITAQPDGSVYPFSGPLLRALEQWRYSPGKRRQVTIHVRFEVMFHDGNDVTIVFDPPSHLVVRRYVRRQVAVEQIPRPKPH